MDSKLSEHFKPTLSVLILAYYPTSREIDAVLDALKAQTFPLDSWELVIIDNGTKPPVAEQIDLSWHPHARCLREERPGTQYARLRGVRECRGDFLLIVDQDNVLAPDYIEEALRIGKEWPMLGAWGGQIYPEYETPPPAWLAPHVHHLALCPVEKPNWASYIHDWAVPYGAGMCFRRVVAEAYLERAAVDPLFQRFGRSAKSAIAGDDHLIPYTATQIGLGVAKFPSLTLKHMIPTQRMEPEYLIKVARGNAHGALLLQLTHANAESYRRTAITPLLKLVMGALFQRGIHRKIRFAEALGELSAVREMRELRQAGTLDHAAQPSAA